MSKKLRKKKSNLFMVGIHLFIVLAVVMVGYYLWRGSEERFDISKYLGLGDKAKPKVEKVEPVTSEFDGLQGRLAENLIKMNLKMGKNFSFDTDLDGSVILRVRVDKSELEITFMTLVIENLLKDEGSTVLESSVLLKDKENQIIARAKDGKIYSISIGYLSKSASIDKAPKLAVIIDDFGEYKGELLFNFCKANKEIAFAVLPNLQYSTEVMEAAIASGHEVLIHIPMEPISYPKNSPGDNAIMVDLDDAEIAKRMKSYFEVLPKAIGANNHMGSRATQDKRVMDIVLDEVKKKNLFFVDSRTIATSVGYETAKEKLMPTAKRNMFLDVPNSGRDVVMEKLKVLAKWKGKRKEVVVISHCFDQERLDNLILFLDGAQKLGYDLVPVSELFVYGNRY